MVITLATVFLFLLTAPSLLLGPIKTMATVAIRATFASISGIQPPPPGINWVTISMEKPLVMTLATVFPFLLMALSLLLGLT